MIALITSAALSAPAADKVTSLPGFNFTDIGFDVYSGYLTVPGPFELTEYDSLSIHYQFHTSQRSPTKDPLVTWHQGGPGASSVSLGLYTEMGYFQLDDKGTHVNPWAWNKVANMLYLESPAGSGTAFLAGKGSSECLKKGKKVRCQWNDVSQAEAYAHTLAAFHKAFPEFAKSDLYLTGESYFGQYGPNIAKYILDHAPFNTTLNLKGIAAGNACWGGDATTVNCNGANSQQNDLDMYYGKGLISKQAYEAAYDACTFPEPTGPKCELAIHKAMNMVGPHNVYFIYDTCSLDDLTNWLDSVGKDYYWLLESLRHEMSTNGAESPLMDLMKASPNGTHNLRYPGADGGFIYGCGGEAAIRTWLHKPEVLKALHLRSAGSGFGYDRGGPASITIWPYLSTKLRVLIYNGDADACVPYKGNEEWIDGLETAGDLKKKKDWAPWFTGDKAGSRAPAGYVTTYTPKGPGDFSFVTIRLAGHMVPTFQPIAAYTMFERFIDGKPF